MDIWNFLARNTSNSKLQYKKWLDVSSGHFSFIDSPEVDIKLVRHIVRRAKETYLETGRYLVYLSTTHFIELEGKSLPVFVTPVELEWNSKRKELSWNLVYSSFQLNQDINLGQIELRIEEIEDWLSSHPAFNAEKLQTNGESLYYDLNQKAFLQKDLFAIQSNKISSLALECLFNEEIVNKKLEIQPDFLSLTHALQMDYSQASSIEMAKTQSCHILGPPGTGKSQTIINLALQEILVGKKVAIVSQKKAALDVICQRMEKLELQNYSLNLMQDNSLIDFYKSLEVSLAECMEYKSKEVPEIFNTTYYKHCIRTLEDYFSAKKQLKDSERVSVEKNGGINISEIHPLFEVYYPNENLISLDPVHLINELRRVQDNLIELPHAYNTGLRLLASLEQPLQLISQIDIKILKKLLKSRKTPSALKQIEKEKKEHLRTQPNEQPFSHLGKEKLNYYLNYLISDQLISKFFNLKAKEITSEFTRIDENWNKYKVWDKIDRIKLALNFSEWDIKMKDIEEREKKIKLEFFQGIEEESLRYILGKLDSKMPSWQLAEEFWLDDKPFHPKQWKELILSIKKLLSQNSELGDWTVSKLIETSLSQPWVMEKSTWDRLCSLNFRSNKEWKNYLSGKNKNSIDFPVLKNYSGKEVILMASFARKYYKEFGQNQLQNELNRWNSERALTLHSLLKSRKQESKFRRDSWKTSIQFLQKKWSSKKLKPSLFQVLNKLELEFLLWLKPITIASLDKFSQYISLQPELYDTLIIDEASQIELLDSIPALVRAKKVIVVGDGQQLTPSRFFKFQNFDYDQPHESLLELAEVKLPTTSLNYQYRAQFRELIQYSNAHFYQNKLKSTHRSSLEAIRRVYLPEGIYHNRVNYIEADEIVSQLVKLSSEFGYQKSIGVVSFSIQQKEAILSRLEMEASTNSEFRAIFQLWEIKLEAFFVKSIEQVQGDERDIILISVGYAKNEQGRLYQFFGPILKHKGENRLNVLMSRAREKMIVITSLLSSQIQVNTSSPPGLIRFKQLLSYIEQPNISTQSSQKQPLNYWQYIFNPFKN